MIKHFFQIACLVIVLDFQAQAQNFIQYVNPLIGTEKMGHTYPGATAPFGAVQLSPDTDTISYEVNGKYNPEVYNYCAGYQCTDKTIVGFSHTHFSGTGHSDLGDILIMPTTGVLQLNPGTADNPSSGFRSAYSHTNEKAEPGYYRVMLDDHHINAEFTATTRVGMHRYTFPASDKAHIILDLVSGIYNYNGKNVYTYVRVINDTLITGYRQTNGWARNRTVYFAIAFSKPFKNYGYKYFGDKEVYRGFWGQFGRTNVPEMAAKQFRAYFDFDTKENEQIQLKVALSPVSMDGALLNMRTEIPHWDFDKVKQSVQQQWNRELGKVEVETITEGDKINFYTSLYHTMIGTTTYNDVDGKYKGVDQEVHEAKNFTNYTTFSLWDTYRALHPWYNLITPKRNSDMVQSMIMHYQQNPIKMLPVWSHYANENWCMIGYHAVPVLADAIVKGNISSFDANAALDAAVATARNKNYGGLSYYMSMGYIPEDKNGSSASKVLEYAFDDWCIAQMAKELKRNDIYDEFSKRSEYYKNVFDPATKFMRAKNSDGKFIKEFNEWSPVQRGYIEGNAWNYSLYVPHDPAAMIDMMGGKEKFSVHLDSLFSYDLPEKYMHESEDITKDGIIGNYVHGNEPSHHVPYLFNWTSTPWKTQEKIRMIIPRMYKPTTDGLGGNDDCGQMSAWYLFSALGFYPVAPGSMEYSIGSPLIKKATIHLENGKQFEIDVQKQSNENVYIERITLNGRPVTKPILNHRDIMNGGKLVFEMGSKPNRKLFAGK